MCKLIKVVMLVFALLAVLFGLILTAAAAFSVVLAVTAGLLTIFAALASIIGLTSAVASDLSMPAMFFTGFFLVFFALSLSTALYILCPKGVRGFRKAMDRIYQVI